MASTILARRGRRRRRAFPVRCLSHSGLRSQGGYRLVRLIVGLSLTRLIGLC